LKQLEIATEWDNIESALHNDEFWLFINKEESAKETRIEFIFELLVGKPSSPEDNCFIFREYHKRFTTNTEETITKNWKDVKRYFQTLQDWFENRELYHKIGFLITTGEDVNKLIEESRQKDKIAFINWIDDNIKNKFSKIQIDDLEYKKNIDSIRKVLLLHNIQTMLNNEKENSRFPFNRYKKERWDIEHIHAIETEAPKTEQHQKDWLNQAKEFIDKTDLITRIDNYSKETFEQLFNDILNYFDENGKHEDINDLSNLVLLDKGTNRGYKNAVFPVKRATIIQKEKTGTFVPVCTKNVFMKYYSPKIEQMTFWGETDRMEYFNDIKTVLKNYLL
jgi:hypothetical protein